MPGGAEIAAGFCVGWSEALVGYPFWTCKTILQNNQSLRSITLRRLYQGVQFPLMSSVAFNTVVFPLKDYLHDTHGVPYALCGAVAGVVVAPQTCFFDTFTIHRQTNQTIHRHMFRGAKGLGMTALRESAALSAYFSTYHAMRDDYGAFMSGAAAGVINWSLTFPVDTVRTRQIAQKCDIPTALRQGRLWKGLRFALARAAVVNAVSFSIYEFVLRGLQPSSVSTANPAASRAAPSLPKAPSCVASATGSATGNRAD